MDLTALQTELAARGFGHLDASGNTRKNYYINLGYHRVCEAEDWPWVMATTTGNSPLTISDLRSVLSVVDSTNLNPLTPIDRESIVNNLGTDLALSGAPGYWYRSSETQISTYAATAVSLSVRYCKVPTDLSSGTDTPIVPTRYQLAIIDAACVQAYMDENKPESAQASEVMFQNKIQMMRETYFRDPVVELLQSAADW